jgi:hypothetical protein
MAALGTWEARGVCYGGGEVATEHVLDLDRGMYCPPEVITSVVLFLSVT